MILQVRSDERGAVVPIVALTLLALFGMVVLAVDVGGLMAKRRGMVNAADSAALAAAQEFAVGDAACQTGVWAPAQSQADAYAGDNIATASNTAFVPNCDQSTIHVVYQTEQDLFFAAVLGFGDSATVEGAATAIWGESTGGNPLPVELDPMLTRDCAYIDPDTGEFQPPDTDCPDGFWFNNQDLTNSGWGLMNLASWGVDPGANCNNAGGADELSKWILQTDPSNVKLKQIPTYVCTTDGGKAPNWFSDLAYWAGKDEVFLFPVNDPSQMILGPPTSIQKYAIVSFAPMKIKALYHGDDPAAIGTVGSSGSCNRNDQDIPAFATINLNTFGINNNCFTSAPDTIRYTSVHLVPRSGPEYVKCLPGNTAGYCDYWYDEPTHVLTWRRNFEATRTRVEFDWSNTGTAGACGSRPSDPNAYCLVLKWGGPQLIGVEPDPDPNGKCMACAVKLVE